MALHRGAEWLPKSPEPLRGLGSIITCGITLCPRLRAEAEVVLHRGGKLFPKSPEPL